MKSIFTLLLISAITSTTAQKATPYLNVTPTFLLPEKQNGAMGVTTSVGYKGKYIAGGIALGGYKLHDTEDGVFLIGSEVLITEFNAKGIRPILTIGAFLPFYQSEINFWEGSNNIEVKSKAKFQVQGALGIAIPIRGKKITLSGGYSILGFKNTVQTTTPLDVSKVNDRTSLKMGTISIGLIL